MTVIQPGTAAVSIEMAQATLTRPAFITFGVDPSATDPVSIAQGVASSITLANSLGSITDSTVTFKSVTVRLGQDGGDPLVGVHPMTAPGTGGALSTLPPNCATLVHKRTAKGGRRHRGRMYLPWCVQEASVSETGVLDPAIVTQTQNAMTIFLNALTTANVPMVLLHSEGVSPVPPATLVTSLTVDALIATQRRRLGR